MIDTTIQANPNDGHQMELLDEMISLCRYDEGDPFIDSMIEFLTSLKSGQPHRIVSLGEPNETAQALAG